MGIRHSEKHNRRRGETCAAVFGGRDVPELGDFMVMRLVLVVAAVAMLAGGGCADKEDVRAQIDRQQQVLDDFQAMLEQREKDLEAAIAAATARLAEAPADAAASADLEKARADKAETGVQLAREASAEKMLDAARTTLLTADRGPSIDPAVGGVLAIVPEPYRSLIVLGMPLGVYIWKQVQVGRAQGKANEATAAANSLINGMDAVRVAEPARPASEVKAHPAFMGQLTPLAKTMVAHESL